MLGEAFTAIGTAFSSRFLLGQFFPVFVLLAVNLLLGCLYVWGLEASLTYAKDHLHLAGLTTVVGLVSTVACAIAFTISPLVNVFERALQGDVFGGKLRELMLAAFLSQAKTASLEVQQRRNEMAMTDRACEETSGAILPLSRERAAPSVEAPDLLQIIVPWLQRTLPGGRRKAKPELVVPSVVSTAPSAVTAGPMQADPVDLATAELGRLEDVQVRLDRAIWDATVVQTPDWATIRSLMTDFVNQMEIVNKLLLSFEAPEDLRKRYDTVITDFPSSQQRARSLVALLYSAARSRFDQQFDIINPKPTRFGNLRAALESYPRRAFGVDYDFLWPRILLVIPKDDPNTAILDQRRAQLDFTLLTMLLTVLFFAAWILGLACTDTNAVRFGAVVLTAPLAAALFYQIALAAQRGFTELAKGFFDRYRLALLTALHVPLPLDDADERIIWKKVASLSAGYRLTDALKFDEKP